MADLGGLLEGIYKGGLTASQGILQGIRGKITWDEAARNEELYKKRKEFAKWFNDFRHRYGSPPPLDRVLTKGVYMGAISPFEYYGILQQQEQFKLNQEAKKRKGALEGFETVSRLTGLIAKDPSNRDVYLTTFGGILEEIIGEDKADTIINAFKNAPQPTMQDLNQALKKTKEALEGDDDIGALTHAAQAIKTATELGLPSDIVGHFIQGIENDRVRKSLMGGLDELTKQGVGGEELKIYKSLVELGISPDEARRITDLATRRSSTVSDIWQDPITGEYYKAFVNKDTGEITPYRPLTPAEKKRMVTGIDDLDDYMFNMIMDRLKKGDISDKDLKNLSDIWLLYGSPAGKMFASTIGALVSNPFFLLATPDKKIEMMKEITNMYQNLQKILTGKEVEMPQPPSAEGGENEHFWSKVSDWLKGFWGSWGGFGRGEKTPEEMEKAPSSQIQKGVKGLIQKYLKKEESTSPEGTLKEKAEEIPSSGEAKEAPGKILEKHSEKGPFSVYVPGYGEVKPTTGEGQSSIQYPYQDIPEFTAFIELLDRSSPDIKKRFARILKALKRAKYEEDQKRIIKRLHDFIREIDPKAPYHLISPLSIVYHDELIKRYEK